MVIHIGEQGITNDDQFRLVLDETQQLTNSLRRRAPEYDPFRRIGDQLTQLQRWILEGHKLSDQDKSLIDVGLIAVRELDGNPDESIQELSDALKEVNLYIDESL